MKKFCFSYLLSALCWLKVNISFYSKVSYHTHSTDLLSVCTLVSFHHAVVSSCQVCGFRHNLLDYTYWTQTITCSSLRNVCLAVTT